MNVNELTENKDGIIDNNTIAQDEEEIRADVKIVQLVSFILDGGEYGINILSVHDILRIPNITRLPNTPNFIRGVLNLRGSIIPVVDMRIRFGFEPTRLTELSRIVVIETNEKQIGMLVDKVQQVVRIPDVNIDPPKDLISGISEEFISGIGRLKDRLIVILAISSILFEDQDKNKSILD